jgi:hypothetical protein
MRPTELKNATTTCLVWLAGTHAFRGLGDPQFSPVFCFRSVVAHHRFVFGDKLAQDFLDQWCEAILQADQNPLQFLGLHSAACTLSSLHTHLADFFS